MRTPASQIQTLITLLLLSLVTDVIFEEIVRASSHFIKELFDMIYVTS